jgi:hypothetical protein
VKVLRNWDPALKENSIYAPAALVAPLLYRFSKLFVADQGVYVPACVSDTKPAVGRRARF